MYSRKHGKKRAKTDGPAPELRELKTSVKFAGGITRSEHETWQFR